MPRLPFLPLILTLIPVLLAWPAKAVQARDTLVLSMAPAEPVVEGMAVLREAYARLGIPVIFRDYPARRGLAEAEAGAADGEVARMGGLGGELPNLIQVQPPVAWVQGVVLTCDPDLILRDKRDLAPLRVGVHPGLRLSDRQVQGLAHVTRGHWDQLFRLLYLGRLDVIIAYDGIERTQAGHPGAKRLRVLRPAAWRAPLYHYLNRRHADLVPRLEAVLERMRADGEMARLHDQAGSAPPQAE